MHTIDVGPRVAARLPEDFETRPYERLTLSPLGPIIGAEVVTGVRLGGDLDDDVRAELRQALLEWKVLFFRDQDVTRDEQRAFAELWGSLEQHPFYRFVHPDQSAADVVTLAKDAANAGVENEWHADITWHARPSFGAVLRAVELPPLGGDTLWADAAAAYDALPRPVRERIDTLRAVHDWRPSFGQAMPPDAVAELGRHLPVVEHPVVRVHPETGRRTLFVNPIFTTHIVGVDADESDRLLAILYRAVTRPDHQCRFRWTPGAIAFWDNRATQHYAASDYAPERRVMERVSIAGDDPFGVDAA